MKHKYYCKNAIIFNLLMLKITSEIINSCISYNCKQTLKETNKDNIKCEALLILLLIEMEKFNLIDLFIL